MVIDNTLLMDQCLQKMRIFFTIMKTFKKNMEEQTGEPITFTVLDRMVIIINIIINI